MFKRVFAKEVNEDILKDLLEAILEITIKKVEVKNPELPKDLINGKSGILDIKVEIDENQICDVEMQVTNQYIAHMKFDETKKEEYVDLGYTKEDELATKDLEMHFIELPKFIKKHTGVNTKLEQWLWLLVGEGEKIAMAENENKNVKKAVEVIDTMSMDEKEWERYRSRKLAEINYNSGMAGAREDGIKERSTETVKSNGKIEIAKELLKMGMEVEKISQATGLSKEEIEKIELGN